jgi:hypothetical protein
MAMGPETTTIQQGSNVMVLNRDGDSAAPCPTDPTLWAR